MSLPTLVVSRGRSHAHRGRTARRIAAAAVIIASLTSAAHAQAEAIYGRATASGLWSDGSAWVDDAGNTGNVPTAADFVAIGAVELPWPSAVSPAAVTLDSSGVAADVVIGNISGTGGGGALTLVAGGSLTAATLSLDSGADGFATLGLGDGTVSLTGVFSMSGTGATVTRTTGGISAVGIDVSSAANYLADGTDTFIGPVTVSGAGGLTIGVAQTGISSVVVTGSGSSFTANAAAGDTSTTVTADDGASVTVNAAVSAYSVHAGNATISLPGGTLSTVDLDLGKTLPGMTTVHRTGGVIATSNLTIANGSSLSLELGDSVADNVTIESGGILTLGQNLTLSANLTIHGGALNLDGSTAVIGGELALQNGAAITRGSGGGIEASTISLSGSTTFTTSGDDSLSGQISVLDGALLFIDTPIAALASLTITGSGSQAAVSAAVSGANAVIDVTDSGGLTMGGDISVTALRVGVGALEIVSGTLSAAAVDVGSFFTGSATVTRGGGTVLADAFTIAGSNAFAASHGDAFGTLVASGGSVVSMVQASGVTTGLRLLNSSSSALSLLDTAVLSLTFDAGSGDEGFDWAFQWTGDHVATVEGLIAAGRIVVAGPEALLATVRYLPELGATVVSVPEPTALLIACTAVGAWIPGAMVRSHRLRFARRI